MEFAASQHDQKLISVFRLQTLPLTSFSTRERDSLLVKCIDGLTLYALVKQLKELPRMRRSGKNLKKCFYFGRFHKTRLIA
jgi:hypothetical protein